MITTPFALISSYSTPFELKHALTLSKATSLFVDAKFLPAVLPVAKEVGLPLNKIFVLTLLFVKQTKTPSPTSFFPVVLAASRKVRFMVDPRLTLTFVCSAVMISHGNLTYSLGQAIVVQQAVAEVYTVCYIPVATFRFTKSFHSPPHQRPQKEF